jgi:hypothetical protein
MFITVLVIAAYAGSLRYNTENLASASEDSLLSLPLIGTILSRQVSQTPILVGCTKYVYRLRS